MLCLQSEGQVHTYATMSSESSPSPFCTQLRPWISVGHHDTDSLGEALVTIEPKSWPNGSTVYYSFMDGTDKYKEIVNTAVAEYTRYANLNLKLAEDGDKSANIRITFKGGSSPSTSAVGIDALRMRNVPTMKLGNLVELSDAEAYALALHEIGHALGLMHEEEDGHSNFPEFSATSVMWITTSLNVELSDSDKAWLVVNYPGKDATIDGTKWTLIRSLGVLGVPVSVMAHILVSSDVSEKRELYAEYINDLYQNHHARKFAESVAEISLRHTPPDNALSEPRPFPRRKFAVVGKPNSDTSTTASSVQAEAEDPEQQFSDSVAAAVMHPLFRTALANMIRDDLTQRGEPVKDQVDVQHSFLTGLLPIGLELLKGGIGLLTQSGIQPDNTQSGIFGDLLRFNPGIFPPPIISPLPILNGIQSSSAQSRVLSPAEQQMMFNIFTDMLKNPIFTGAIKGAINGLTGGGD